MQLQFTRGRRTRRFYRWGGVALTIVATAYFLGYVAENWSRLPTLLWNGRGIAVVAAAFGLYGEMLLLVPIAWLLLLRAGLGPNSVVGRPLCYHRWQPGGAILGIPVE